MRTCSTCHRKYPDDMDFCPRDATPLPALAAATEAELGIGLAGRYRIVRRLGAGGMGSVFLAEQLNLGNRTVALKILRRQLLDDPEFLQRFHNEAASTARIHHHNVVSIYESGQTDDGSPYISMEYLEGESLRQLLKSRGALPAAEAAEILQQVSRGLNAAHKLGIIHRDLKPDNIFLTHDDEGQLLAKIVDFGIAKMRESSTHTLTGLTVGTPAYMSFEQASGMRSDELDARSDVYSLGVVAYEVLTGCVPFHSDTPLGCIRKHLMEAPPPFRLTRPDLNIPVQLEQVVMRALAKERDQRYATAPDFAREFSAATTRPASFTTEEMRLLDRLASERAEREQAAQQKAEQERAEQERRAREKMEAERLAAQEAEAERVERESAERESAEAARQAAEKREAERVGREKAERERVAREKAEVERLAAQRLEPERWARQTAETERDPATRRTAGKAAAERQAGQKELGGKRKGLPVPVLVGIAAVVVAVAFVGVLLYLSGSGRNKNAIGTARRSSSGQEKASGPPAEIVSLPAGTFMMGRDNADDPEETPAHSVTVGSFYLDKTPVTNAAYAEFVRAASHEAPSSWTGGSYPPMEADWPVVHVSWNDAEAYCQWRGEHLPAEAEWEYAARGTDGRLYPWGNDFSQALTNSIGARLGSPESVGTRPGNASPFGALDMSGNIWEWTADDYRPYAGHQATFEIPSDAKVIRGGSYQSDQLHVTTTTRNLDHASTRSASIGFRCAKSL